MCQQRKLSRGMARGVAISEQYAEVWVYVFREYAQDEEDERVVE